MIFLIAFAVALFLYSLLILIKQLGKENFIFMAPEEGHVVFVMASGTLKKIITDPHHTIEGEKVVVKNRPMNLFEWATGVVFYGIPPFRTIHEFEVITDKIIEGKDLEGSEGKKPKLGGMKVAELVRYGSRVVKKLKIKIPHPIYINDADLPDGSKLDILVQVTFEVVDPRIFVFMYDGNVSIVDKAVHSAVTNFCKTHRINNEPLTIKTWSRLDSGPESDFIKEIYKIDDPSGSSEAVKNITEQFGLKIEDVRFVRADEDETTAEMGKALRDKELQNLKGAGVIEAAKAKAEAIKLVGDAEADVWKSKASAVGGNREAAHVLAAEQLAQAAANHAAFQGQYLSVGNQSAGMVLPPLQVSSQKGTDPDKVAGTET